MKRFFVAILVVTATIGMLISGNTAATASSKPAPVPTDRNATPNVQISYYHDTESNTDYIVVWRFAPTKRDPYRWIECKPNKCGTIAITGKRHRTKASLQLVSSEKFVNGWYGYTDSNWDNYVSGRWNGSSKLLNQRFRTDRGRPIRMHLDTLYADVYNPAFPVPVSDDCYDCPVSGGK